MIQQGDPNAIGHCSTLGLNVTLVIHSVVPKHSHYRLPVISDPDMETIGAALKLSGTILKWPRLQLRKVHPDSDGEDVVMAYTEGEREQTPDDEDLYTLPRGWLTKVRRLATAKCGVLCRCLLNSEDVTDDRMREFCVEYNARHPGTFPDVPAYKTGVELQRPLLEAALAAEIVQSEVFERFLHGITLDECYMAVAAVANRWLDMLENQGADLADSELLDYISESSTMSKSLAEYGEAKSYATTTVKRLADFLGDSMVKDKSLSCRYIAAQEPQGASVAILVAIFETDYEIMNAYVRK